MRQTGHTLDIVYDYSEEFEKYCQPIVKAKVDGEELNFLIDTGASISSIPRSFKKRHSLKDSGYKYDTTILNGTKTLESGAIFEVTISEKKFKMEALYYEPMLNGKLKIDGLIGYEFLKENGLIVNAENHTLCVNTAQTKESQK